MNSNKLQFYGTGGKDRILNSRLRPELRMKSRKEMSVPDQQNLYKSSIVT